MSLEISNVISLAYCVGVKETSTSMHTTSVVSGALVVTDGEALGVLVGEAEMMMGETK